MSVRNSIHGLLAQKPRHGYELRVAFEAVVGGDANWDVKPAQIYTTLDRLEEAGLVERSSDLGEGEEPSRRVYALTSKGDQVLREWFADGVATEHQRDEFFVKLMIGLISGQAEPALGMSASAALREYYSTLEETRADLVALYFAPHPKLAELGIVEAEHLAEIACAEYEAFARNALVQLRRVREGTHLEEDHMRNRQLIVRWLMKHTHAVQERWRDGKTFYVVTDVHGFHDGAGRLLADVQRIKSQGDYAAARALVDTYGTHFDPALRDEIVARVQHVDLPSYTGFVMPSLEPLHGPDGRIANVRIFYPLDLHWPPPLIVAQILWIHLICDGPSDIVLGFEPKENGIMEAKPKSIKEPILTPLGLSLIAVISIASSICALLLFGHYYQAHHNPIEGRSIVFASFGINSMIYIFAYRSMHQPLA